MLQPVPVSRVVDLLDPSLNRIGSMDIEEARRRVLSGDPAAVRAIDGSFALVAVDPVDSTKIRLARSMDRPMRYFLAKRREGPALFVADRIDALRDGLAAEGLDGQFHPSYTRMVPAHYVVDLALIGCPDPDPIYTRFFTPARGTLPPDLDEIGARYIGALADEAAKWLRDIDTREAREAAAASSAGGIDPASIGQAPTSAAPIGVAFSGGIDSGSVFLVIYHAMLRLGMSPSRLKAFVLNLGGGPDVEQAREFLSAAGLSLFLEEIDARPDDLDVNETLRVLEDYKSLDVECAAMGLRLCRGIRERYPDWKYLADGDGGDENLKDYPIEENPELTIRSVVDNLMLYQEGWGVGRIKHSLTYTGGLSRSYVRTYAPARRYGFEGFSPYTRPNVIEVAEGIPFAALTRYDVPTLYALKGEIVRRGIKAVTGIDMPVYPKRRFQHGAIPAATLHAALGRDENAFRRAFHAMYA
jgi:asparagine synthase (glutamine-hydrolysing)